MCAPPHKPSVLARIAAEGRKFGLGLIVSTQQAGLLPKQVVFNTFTEIVMRLGLTTVPHVCKPENQTPCPPCLGGEISYARAFCYVTAAPFAIADPKWYRLEIWRKSGGNPRAIKDLLGDHALEKYVDLGLIQSMHTEQGRKEIAMATGA